MKHNPIIRFIVTMVILLLPIIIGSIGVIFFGWRGDETLFNCLVTYVVSGGFVVLLMLVWGVFFAEDYVLWKKEQAERLKDEKRKKVAGMTFKEEEL